MCAQTVAEADPRRAAHLARLTAALVSGGSVPLSVLKVRLAQAFPAGAMLPCRRGMRCSLQYVHDPHARDCIAACAVEANRAWLCNKVRMLMGSSVEVLIGR